MDIYYLLQEVCFATLAKVLLDVVMSRLAKKLGILQLSILLLAGAFSNMAAAAEAQKPKLYFAHPLNTYNTELEAKLLGVIKREFPHWDIENPNQKQHDEGVRRWRAKTGNPMDYYTDELLPVCCKGGIFLPLRDGKWSAGVFLEAQFFLYRGMPVWKIDHNGFVTPINRLSIKDALSPEESRARYRDAQGNKIPY